MCSSFADVGPAPFASLFFCDSYDRELRAMQGDFFAAVYAAGGGKRNMANFVKDPLASPPYRTGDVFLSLSLDHIPADAGTTLFVCRYSSGLGSWVAKPLEWTGERAVRFVPEWFKARFWDNKQEKKHPWFMFALGVAAPGHDCAVFCSESFPVHQYYPTGPRKTDPNMPATKMALHQLLKQAPPATISADKLQMSLLRDQYSLGSAHTDFQSSADSFEHDDTDEDLLEDAADLESAAMPIKKAEQQQHMQQLLLMQQSNPVYWSTPLQSVPMSLGQARMLPAPAMYSPYDAGDVSMSAAASALLSLQFASYERSPLR